MSIVGTAEIGGSPIVTVPIGGGSGQSFPSYNWGKSFGENMEQLGRYFGIQRSPINIYGTDVYSKWKRNPYRGNRFHTRARKRRDYRTYYYIYNHTKTRHAQCHCYKRRKRSSRRYRQYI